MFYNFDVFGVAVVYEVGGVDGLARPAFPGSNQYTILYVGQSGNLRERLQSHLNDPPTAGITHFFAERIDNLIESSFSGKRLFRQEH